MIEMHEVIRQRLLSKLAQRVAQKKPGEFAPGIPARGSKAAIPRVTRFGKPVTWWYVDHRHEAVRAGMHTDLRLSDGYKAYSWAVRKGMPMMPGQKVLAIRQPDHSPRYMSFEGQIPSGYGRTKGRGVWIAEQGPVRIIQASPQKIRFTIVRSQNPRQYTMVHQGGDKWLLINTTPTPTTRPGVPQSKPKYREAKPELFERFVSNGARTAVMAKIDGSHVSMNFDRESPEIYSHRPSERDTGLIDHTYVAGLERVKTPKKLKGTRLRGEIYAVDDKGKAIPNRELAGILNASPMKGRNKLQEKNLKVRLGIFDVITGPGGKDMSSSPWGEKHKVLRKVEQSLGRHGFHIPDTAFTPSQQKELFRKILSGKHKETEEGVVVWPTRQADRPTKIKFRPHHQVYIHKIHEGTGAMEGTLGRYSYSLTPGGPPVGFVGTGFNRKQRDWMWKNRHKLKGRKVVIKSLEQFPSGAFRAPSHSHFHL